MKPRVMFALPFPRPAPLRRALALATMLMLALVPPVTALQVAPSSVIEDRAPDIGLSTPTNDLVSAATSPTPEGRYSGRLIAPRLGPLGNPLTTTGPIGAFTGVSTESFSFPADPSGWQYTFETTGGTIEACFRGADETSLECVLPAEAIRTIPDGTMTAFLTLTDGINVPWVLDVLDVTPPYPHDHFPGLGLTRRFS